MVPPCGWWRVEDFRSTVHQAELRRIAHIGTGNRRGGIAERIGAIPHRLVFEPKVLVLQVHVVDAERLAAIVDRTATWAIGIGQRIALRQEIALLIERAESLVADFMIDQHKLAEIRAGPVLNDRLPAAGGRRGIACTERLQVARSARLDDKRAEQAHHRQLTVLAYRYGIAGHLPGCSDGYTTRTRRSSSLQRSNRSSSSSPRRRWRSPPCSTHGYAD